MQTSSNNRKSSQEEYVESSIRVVFGGMQPMIVTGKVTWADYKYNDKNEQEFKFGLNCGSGVSIRSDNKTEYPYSTHWFTILSNKASQDAKSLDNNKDENDKSYRGTNAEQMAQNAVVGTYMTVVYFPQVNADGTPRCVILEKKEGNQTVEVAQTNWGTYGGSAILAVAPIGTQDEREAQAAFYEAKKAGKTANAQQSKSKPATTTGRGNAWRNPASTSKPAQSTPVSEPDASDNPPPPPATRKVAWGKTS